MTVDSILLCIAGLGLLVGGAELLVRSASRLASAVGVSPLIIGLTVVAYGTSAPEFAVSVKTALSGHADISLGNVVGGNIFNTLCILGISAVILPLIVRQRLLWLDVPVMIGASAVLYTFAFDGRLSRLEGLALLAAGVVYTAFCVRQSRNEPEAVKAEYGEAFAPDSARRGGAVQFTLVGVSLVLLVAGARWFTIGAVQAAGAFGVSELIIGLTLAGIGTSLPELAASVTASLHGKQDIAVGNVVGSNIFRMLWVVGAAGAAAPADLGVSPALLWFDLPVALATAVACLPIFFTGHAISRWEGFVFFGYYIAYLLFLVLNATGHDMLPAFSRVMLAFVIPITGLTLVVLAGRALRSARP